MPSLWNESFGLVAVEAMLNGIPVLASNRGALGDDWWQPHPNPLPEGDGGFLFDIPARYTPETRDVPTAEEVAPWVETIIRLWDDAAEYDRASLAARVRAKAWHPDRLAPLYRDFFSRVSCLPKAAGATYLPAQPAKAGIPARKSAAVLLKHRILRFLVSTASKCGILSICVDCFEFAGRADYKGCCEFSYWGQWK